jgi:hypothetical protein
MTTLEAKGSKKGERAKMLGIKGQQRPVNDFNPVEIARSVPPHPPAAGVVGALGSVGLRGASLQS